VADLTVEDPPLEAVMKELFARSREEREAGAAGAVDIAGRAARASCARSRRGEARGRGPAPP
jgi:hypothetical protein